ncbi:MAG TPA: helix-turn-helix transcriptional regulator, partial [Candidatus Baltobacteraceae bacterium]|nr:helix-turn-helix transcriptional regulator [Candidatus Baltobacteraceae bacterium]
MNEREDVRQTNTRENHRRELARFLRARRESISPGEAGLAQHGRRRTPGLRREEVALLAGIGVAWYSKLEMGHDVTASASTLLAIARALQLNPAQTEYLFALTDVAVPRVLRPAQSGIPEAIEQLVLSTHHVGAVIWDRYMTALRWNAI